MSGLFDVIAEAAKAGVEYVNTPTGMMVEIPTVTPERLCQALMEHRVPIFAMVAAWPCDCPTCRKVH